AAALRPRMAKLTDTTPGRGSRTASRKPALLMTVADNLIRVRERIADAALRSGRTPDAITLVGCKPASVDQVLQAAQAGLLDIGENRVQEAVTKVPQVARDSVAPVRWHLIG